MLFSSNIFLFLFLPFILIAYFFSPNPFRNYLLLLASLFFYSWGEVQYSYVLLISLIFNYYFGLLLGSKDKARLTLSLAIAFNLLLLAYFKYSNFMGANLSYLLELAGYQWNFVYGPAHLPIGISFFTFHSISYLIDIYRGKVQPQRSFTELALYISLFPQLIAGPIIRYNTIAAQLPCHKRRHHPLLVAYGIRRFIIGLGKKVLIANPLALIADKVFSLPTSELSLTISWAGIIAYSLQLFYDFSGYSDMAIGLARIFGFKFTENFNYPYIARSVREFWQRWHISLSSWFRDYLYIPLGGNRCSNFRQYFNLIIVFFLCGLWHGASWNFVVWGLFHGLFLILERNPLAQKLLKQLNLPAFLGHFYTLLVVISGWVFFRSPNLGYALKYLGQMFFRGRDGVYLLPSEIKAVLLSHLNLTALACALLLSFRWDVKLTVKSSSAKSLLSITTDFWLIIIFLLSIIRLASATHNPFIYFQF